jgi:3-methyladenine DNA glycosylase AlkD
MTDPLAELHAHADPARAIEMAAYHKVPRPYLGVPVPAIEDLTDRWRAERSVEDRVDLAATLWDTNIHDARVAAAKLLTQARLRPDDVAWALICTWVPQFDAWAIADHACKAGERRLLADPSRLDTLEAWLGSSNMWVRRAALVMTLPWTKQNHPKPDEVAIRDRVLGWAADMADDRDWFIQKAIAWWVRDLSKHDLERAKAFLEAHGARLKPFARKEAAKYLGE